MQIKIAMRYHLLEWLKFRTMTTAKLEWMWNHRSPHSLLVGMKNGIASLEDQVTVFYKPKPNLI